jgi:predicted O-methyltransferase YrrM
MLPELNKRGVTIDFVFIDGMHTFDYTVLDLFYADKLLRPGGIICLHDMELPSKRKAFSYLMKYRKYVRLSGLEEQFGSRMGHALRYAVQAKPRATWNVLTSMGSIGVAQKTESYEPNWDFYARF